MGGVESSLLPVLSNLGIGGFAIFIMWKMFDANGKEREKHTASAQLEREKYLSMATETQKNFNLYQERVQSDIMSQLDKNTDTLTRVLDHFSKHN